MAAGGADTKFSIMSSSSSEAEHDHASRLRG